METALPFSIPNAYQGFATVEGLARFDGEALVLEFQTADALMGLVKSEVKEVRLGLADLVAVEFKKRLFGATLGVRARSLAVIEAIPGTKLAGFTLRFARPHRDAAHGLATHLQLRLSEHRLDAMDDELRRLGDG